MMMRKAMICSAITDTDGAIVALAGRCTGLQSVYLGGCSHSKAA
jgi:hypothetical protein